VPDAQEHKLLLWGDSQVGKTSLIAAAFFSQDSDPRLAAIDFEGARASKTGAVLFESWRELRSNRLVSPTVEPIVDLRLPLTTGGSLVVRDIKGGTTQQEDVNQIRQDASAIFFLLEWAAKDLNAQLLAMENLLSFTERIVRAVVFTKCEQGLTWNDRRWLGETDWWRTAPEWDAFAMKIGRFKKVFPTSAYGYLDGGPRPAVILGEFGQVLPFMIRPKGVVEPFAWLLEALGIDRQ
jgi:hypothetical protein